MYLPQETIRRKRDGETLSSEEIADFVAGLVDGRVGDAQAAAFAMATLLKGMVRDERVALTRAMTRSGRVIDWRSDDLGGPVLDKHSTGGVGDKVSLLLAPMVAACGGFVPMISGRGLGHTGGTLDKLDSIPGYDSRPPLDRLRRVVAARGCAIVGATAEIAPADRRLYAIRDISGTVESLDLITASILSKKLAAGLDALVMDVKTGSGAFAAARAAADRLAETLVDVGTGAGLRMRALVTDMDRVLGRTAGNALEVAEAIDALAGRGGDPRLLRVTEALAAHLLVLGGLADDLDTATAHLRATLADGRAAERFQAMVADLGGPADLVERPDRHLPQAPVVRPVFPERPGRLATVDARALGLAVIRLGGGRAQPGDRVDPAVGLAAVAAPGSAVGAPGRPLAIVHAAGADAAEAAARTVRAAMQTRPEEHDDTSPTDRITATDPVLAVLGRF